MILTSQFNKNAESEFKVARRQFVGKSFLKKEDDNFVFSKVTLIVNAMLLSFIDDAI